MTSEQIRDIAIAQFSILTNYRDRFVAGKGCNPDMLVEAANAVASTLRVYRHTREWETDARINGGATAKPLPNAAD